VTRSERAPNRDSSYLFEIADVLIRKLMPIYVYKPKDISKSCDSCRKGVEILQRISDKPLNFCPKCGNLVKRVISHISLGESKTGLDRRAKEKGFHKLKKVDKGKYEKLY